MLHAVQIYVIRPPSVTRFWIKEIVPSRDGFNALSMYMLNPDYDTRPGDLIVAFDHNEINIESAYVKAQCRNAKSIKLKRGGFHKRVPDWLCEHKGIDYGMAWNTFYEDAGAEDLANVLEDISFDPKMLLFIAARSILAVCRLLPKEIRKEASNHLKAMKLIQPSRFPGGINISKRYDDIDFEMLQECAMSLIASVVSYQKKEILDQYRVNSTEVTIGIVKISGVGYSLADEDGSNVVRDVIKKYVSFDKLMSFL